MYDPSRKMKQSQPSSDDKTAGADGENHLDISLEEEEVSDLSPKKTLELGDGSKFDEGPHRVLDIHVAAFIILCVVF